MQPTGEQLQRLQAALLNAFDHGGLRRMVSDQLEANLDHIALPASGPGLADIVFTLVSYYAVKPKGIATLVAAARHANRANPRLAAVAQEFAGIEFDPLPERPMIRRRLWINVPPRPAHFLGRDVITDELVTQLCAGRTATISAEGLPGVGKTALAIMLAHDDRVLAHFRDGVLWAGLGRTPDVASIHATWADHLGVQLTDTADPLDRLPHPKPARPNCAKSARSRPNWPTLWLPGTTARPTAVKPC